MLLIALGFLASAGLDAVAWAGGLAPAATAQAAPLSSHWHIVPVGVPDAPVPSVVARVVLEATWVALAAIATWWGFSRGSSMLGRSATTKVAVAVLTPLAFVATWVVVAVAGVNPRDAAPDASFDAICALFTIACGLGPLAAFVLIRRRSDPESPWTTGAALGAVAGAWAAVLYMPLCGCTSTIHVLLAHVAPGVALAGLGGGIGRRIIGIRDEPTAPSTVP